MLISSWSIKQLRWLDKST